LLLLAVQSAIANASVHSASSPNLLGNREDFGKNNVEDENVEVARQRIRAIYKLHASTKVDKVDALLTKYKGNEKWLISQVEEKYSVASTDIIDGTGVVKMDEEKKGEVEVDDAVEVESEGGESGEEESGEEESGEEESGEEESGEEESGEEESGEEEEVMHLNSPVPVPNPETNVASPQPPPPPPENSMLLQHDMLLTDFDRIYPIPNTKLHFKHPNFEAMKDYIFQEDVKRQMRLRAPLQQRKTASAAEYEMNFANGGGDVGVGGYNSRGDRWGGTRSEATNKATA